MLRAFNLIAPFPWSPARPTSAPRAPSRDATSKATVGPDGIGSFCGFRVGGGKADRQGAKDAKGVKLAVGSFCRNRVGWCALVRGDGHRGTGTLRHGEEE